jgi:hypothetical protein
MVSNPAELLYLNLTSLLKGIISSHSIRYTRPGSGGGITMLVLEIAELLYLDLTSLLKGRQYQDARSARYVQLIKHLAPLGTAGLKASHTVHNNLYCYVFRLMYVVGMCMQVRVMSNRTGYTFSRLQHSLYSVS